MYPKTTAAKRIWFAKISLTLVQICIGDLSKEIFTIGKFSFRPKTTNLFQNWRNEWVSGFKMTYESRKTKSTYIYFLLQSVAKLAARKVFLLVFNVFLFSILFLDAFGIRIYCWGKICRGTTVNPHFFEDVAWKVRLFHYFLQYKFSLTLPNMGGGVQCAPY